MRELTQKFEVLKTMRIKLWTISEVMELTGFSSSKLRGDIRSGELTAEKIGGSLRIRHSNLIKYLRFDPFEEPEIKTSTIKKTTKKRKNKTHQSTSNLTLPFDPPIESGDIRKS